MTTVVEGILARMKSDPPTGSRDLAYRLKALWEAYSPEVREALKRDHSYPYCPDVPEVSSTQQGILATLLNSEEEYDFDVSPCWEALDRGLNHTFVKHMLFKAKKAYLANPSLVFRQHLAALLAKKRRKRTRQKKVVAQTQKPRVTPENLPPQKEATPMPPATPMPSNLREPTRTHARVRAHSLGMTESDYIHWAVDEDCKASGTVEYVERSRRRDQPTPQAAAPTAAPAAKPAKKVRSRKAKPRVEVSPPSTKEAQKPSLRERLRIVMGKDPCTIPQVISRLKARNRSWLPESTDLNAYISLALSTNKSTFERVTRGVYKVRVEANAIEDLGENISENPFANAAE